MLENALFIIPLKSNAVELPGEKSSCLRARASECYSTAGQKDYTMEAVENGRTRLMYGAQDRAISRRERCHMRYEDSGGVSVLPRRRLVQEQYIRIRQQLKEKRSNRASCEAGSD